MKIAINTGLVSLAKIFKKNGSKLFLVGGYVRNSILGFPTDDIDLAGDLKLDEVKEIVKGSEFTLREKNRDLGTAEILYGDKVWEYVTFRKEQYSEGGNHSPSKVEFIKSPEEDSARRDFTINAIFLDILKGDILDYHDGIKDAKKRVIRAVNSPDAIFASDGLRILRMIRLACELGFSIEPKTLLAAILNKEKLNDISGVRKRNELMLILNCQNRYPDFTHKKAFLKGLVRFNSMKLWRQFFLPVDKVRLSLVKKVDIGDRFIGLVIDIVNSVNPRDKSLFLYNFLGSEGLCFTAGEVELLSNIILGYTDAIDKLNNKDYFFKYFNNFKTIANLIRKKSKGLYKKYNFFYNYLINNKVAIQIKDLAIKGADIKSSFPKIPAKRYSYILNELLSKVFDGVIKNNKQVLLGEVANYDY